MIDDYCEAHGIHGVIEAVNIYIENNVLINVKAYKSDDRGWIVGQRSGVVVPHSELAEDSGKIMSVLHDTLSHYPT